MRALGSLVFVSTLILAGAVLACAPQDVPGEVVGTYHMVGPREANECGDMAFPAAETMDMRVELRRDLTMAIWRRPQAAISYGVIQDDEPGEPERWIFDSGASYPAYEGCAFVQEERIVLERVEPDGVSGTVRLRVYPEPGSDCSASLVVVGGPFLTLPCEARWTLEGEPIDPLF